MNKIQKMLMLRYLIINPASAIPDPVWVPPLCLISDLAICPHIIPPIWGTIGIKNPSSDITREISANSFVVGVVTVGLMN